MYQDLNPDHQLNQVKKGPLFFILWKQGTTADDYQG